MKYFYQLCLRASNNYSEQIAIVHKQQSLTYHQLWQQIEHFAAHFFQLGIRTGDRVIIYAPKRIETIIAMLAVSRIGAIFVPLNPLLKAPQVRDIIEDCQPALMIISSPFAQKMAEFSPINDKLQQLILFSDSHISSDASSKNIFWQNLVHQKPGQTIDSKDDVSPIAALFYTSGSTGKPKGVMITQQNLLLGAQKVSSYCKLSNKDRILSLLPLSFDYGFNQISSAFSVGASIYLHDYLFPKDVFNGVKLSKATGLAGVPSLWNQLIRTDWQNAQMSSLRFITNSGGRLVESSIDCLREKLPNCAIYSMYGLTEAFRSTYLEPDLIDKYKTSIGKPLAGEELFIIDEQGKPLGEHQVGQLVHRGQLVTAGYWNDHQKTLQIFKTLDEKYFTPSPYKAVLSGDYAYRDEYGFYYFVERRDNLIKCSGNRINPQDIESMALSSKMIEEAAVVAKADERLGQAIFLFISPLESFHLNDFKKFLMNNLPNFMQPKSILSLKQLPKTPNGKLDKVALLAQIETNNETGI